MPKVSIVIITYNDELYIGKCIESVLKQALGDFELIIIDDCSTDKTSQIIRSFQDSRIEYVKNEVNMGIPRSRNIGIGVAKSEYIFFIDGDCFAQKNWLECGLIFLEENEKINVTNIVGVQGRTFYSTARTTISDRIVEVSSGDLYNTCNILYKRKYLGLTGGFNSAYDLAHEDIDLAFRVLKYGEILFCEDMIVIHQRKKLTKNRILSDAKRARNLVHLIKEHKDYNNMNLFHRILFPKKLLIMICPLLLILSYSIRSWEDIKTTFWMYVAAWYMRVAIWRAAIEERIFIL